MTVKPKDRLKDARAKAGYATPSDASRALRDVNINTLISHENGNRDISRKAAETYAKAFGTSASWILYGDKTAVDPETQMRSALLAFGVDQDDLGRVLNMLRGYVADAHERLSEQTPHDDQSEPSTPRRASVQEKSYIAYELC